VSGINTPVDTRQTIAVARLARVATPAISVYFSLQPGGGELTVDGSGL
jgi:hypothetical protein